jgi:hypothetical protein
MNIITLINGNIQSIYCDDRQFSTLRKPHGEDNLVTPSGQLDELWGAAILEATSETTTN